MKKIFLESHHINNPFFGFGQFNYHLLKGFSKLDYPHFEIIVHAKNKSKLSKEFGNKFSYKKYQSLRRYEAFRIREKYDLWHSLNQNTKIEPSHNIPYLLTVHNITFIKDKKNYMQERVHQKFQKKLNRSNAIIYISNYAKSSTHEFFNIPNVPEYVIHNGNPISKLTITPNFRPTIISKKPYLFSIGEFTDRKNFKSLVRMLFQLPEYNLILAGKNSTSTGNEIRKLITEKKLEGRVFLPGKVSEEEKQYYYKNCEAFVFPSLREGFGLPIIEAMNFGVPIFTSNNTALPEIGGELIFYWNGYDAEYMAHVFRNGLKTFRKNENWYKEKLILRARSFNWDKAAQKYLEVYNSLL